MYFSGLNNIECNVYFPNNITFKYGNNAEIRFTGCGNYDSKVVLPDNLQNCYYTMVGANIFNTQINIPSAAKNCQKMFDGCGNFNQPVTIPNNVLDCTQMFNWCVNFDKPVTINGAYGCNCTSMFLHCKNFDSVVNISNNVTDCSGMFVGCDNFTHGINLPDSVMRYSHIVFGCDNYHGYISLPSIYNYDIEQLPEIVGGSEFLIGSNYHGTIYDHTATKIYCRKENVYVNQVPYAAYVKQNETSANRIDYGSVVFGWENCYKVYGVNNSIYDSLDKIIGGYVVMAGYTYTSNSINKGTLLELGLNAINYAKNWLYNFYGQQDDGTNGKGSNYSKNVLYNDPTEIPLDATSLTNYFNGCEQYNQPTTIPNLVINTQNMFRRCYNLNRPITFMEYLESEN